MEVSTKTPPEKPSTSETMNASESARIIESCKIRILKVKAIKDAVKECESASMLRDLYRNRLSYETSHLETMEKRRNAILKIVKENITKFPKHKNFLQTYAAEFEKAVILQQSLVTKLGEVDGPYETIKRWLELPATKSQPEDWKKQYVGLREEHGKKVTQLKKEKEVLKNTIQQLEQCRRKLSDLQTNINIELKMAVSVSAKQMKAKKALKGLKKELISRRDKSKERYEDLMEEEIEIRGRLVKDITKISEELEAFNEERIGVINRTLARFSLILNKQETNRRELKEATFDLVAAASTKYKKLPDRTLTEQNKNCCNYKFPNFAEHLKAMLPENTSAQEADSQPGTGSEDTTKTSSAEDREQSLTKSSLAKNVEQCSMKASSSKDTEYSSLKPSLSKDKENSSEKPGSSKDTEYSSLKLSFDKDYHTPNSSPSKDSDGKVKKQTVEDEDETKRVKKVKKAVKQDVSPTKKVSSRKVAPKSAESEDQPERNLPNPTQQNEGKKPKKKLPPPPQQDEDQPEHNFPNGPEQNEEKPKRKLRPPPQQNEDQPEHNFPNGHEENEEKPKRKLRPPPQQNEEKPKRKLRPPPQQNEDQPEHNIPNGHEENEEKPKRKLRPPPQQNEEKPKRKLPPPPQQNEEKPKRKLPPPPKQNEEKPSPNQDEDAHDNPEKPPQIPRNDWASSDEDDDFPVGDYQQPDHIVFELDVVPPSGRGEALEKFRPLKALLSHRATDRTFLSFKKGQKLMQTHVATEEGIAYGYTRKHSYSKVKYGYFNVREMRTWKSTPKNILKNFFI
ncbi:muscle M-line assembly protein unc-89-like [Ylistrum balloti]|uniref:muscle M-line assembly protein unc-89-like n=1 Tax=Ylistrum balloti TaxID=509963 RepID=UPI002905F5D7|nr:muscle M-line assembly protein unc-89-like [Ylistrum balloti]